MSGTTAKPREIRNETGLCTMCGAAIECRTVTSPRPDAPDMIQVNAPAAWMGFTVDGPGSLGLVVVCSDACVQALLKE